MTKLEDKKTASVNGGSPTDKDFANAINRLAELEDMIESGLLVELPCKIGDTLYGVGTFYYGEITEEIVKSIIIDTVHGITISTNIYSYPLSYLGRLLFKTKESAEAKLNELKGIGEPLTYPQPPYPVSPSVAPPNLFGYRDTTIARNRSITLKGE